MTHVRRALAVLGSLVLALCVASCGLVVSFDEFGTAARRTIPDAAVASTRYAVRGLASGLEGKKITLLMNGQSLEAGEGAFASLPTLADGERYEVTVREAPTDLTCSVDNGAGTIAGGDASGVLVHCASSDALLADITLSGLPLSPVFSPRVLDYRAQIRVFDVFTASRPILTVTATTHRPDAVVSIAGVPATSGKPSPPMTLEFGQNRILVVVVAPDQRQLHYTVLVNVKVCDYLKPADNTPQVWDIPQPSPPSVPGPPIEALLPPGFGTSVSISGDTLAVGSYKVVHVFRRTGRIWSQEALLPINLGTQQDPVTLALSGDTLVVAAPDVDSSTGAAVVFRRSGTTWAQEASLAASNARPGASFGGALALAGDTLAVGSGGESSLASGINGDQGDTAPPLNNRVGAVYVFTRTGSVWSQRAYIKASNSQPGAGFGSAIALSGETLVATGASAGYVFTGSGSTWSEQAIVTASSGLSSAAFGRAVALSGDTLAIGAPTDSSNATGINGDPIDTSGQFSGQFSGAVYVFTRSGTAWSQQAYVKASNTMRFGAFGTAIALSGDTLAVSSPWEQSSTSGINGDQKGVATFGAGAVYRFVRSGTTWSQQAYVKASNTSANAYFGTSVGLSGDTLVVGAPGDRSLATGINGDETTDPSNPKLGAAYVY